MALYPPILASSMPAFNIYNGKVRIYYTLSNYNGSKTDEIKKVHVTVRRQSSNVNKVINSNEILEKDFFESNEPEDRLLNRYYIEINDNEIINGFEADVLYKVQLRFSTVASNGQANFFTNNIENFSLWSTVCIIKPIEPPTIYIDDFYIKNLEHKELDLNNFNYNLADFVGIFNLYNEKTKKISSLRLKTWRLRLLKETYSRENKLNIDLYTLADSGLIASSAYNYNTSDNQSMVLECSLPYLLLPKNKYKLLFSIKTKNDYEDDILYYFQFQPISISALAGVLKTSINEELGYIKVDYDAEGEIYTGNIVLRRTDSKSDFLKWEDLKHFLSYGDGSFNYYDFTAESGIAYRYLVQKKDARGRRGAPLYDLACKIGKATIAEWEHAFLLLTTGNGDAVQAKQLKLKFDFQISSFKTNISESKTDTIGAKYPYIRRNGNMYYRSFPCSGTITSCMDNASLFTSKNLLNDNHSDIYDLFNGITEVYGTKYDYTYERKFRELVESFLYNIKPKLYKSMQEGNIFIKLMEVNLTPKNELGRMIYTFSATAYEIDLATINSLNAYGLINVGTYNPHIIIPPIPKIAQVSSFLNDENPFGRLFKAGLDIIGTGSAPAANSIAKHHKYNQSINNQIIKDFEITWLRITVESEPYLIKLVNGKFYPIDDVDNENSPYIELDRLSQKRASIPSFKDKSYIKTDGSVSNIGNSDFDIPSDPGNINYKLYQIESTYDEDNIYLGTLFDIQISETEIEQIIISYPNNVYLLKDDNVFLSKNSKLIPYKDTALSIDYVIALKAELDITKVPKFERVDMKSGQLIDIFNSTQEIVNRIKFKYQHSYTNNEDFIKQRVNGVNTILIDTEPGAVIKLKTTASTDNLLFRFVVNHTGELNFNPNDSQIYIEQLYICGMNIPKTKTQDRGSFESLNLVYYPIDKDKCTVQNIDYIYYKSRWYKAKLLDNEESYDIDCPIDALVFYEINLRREFY